MFLFPKGKGAYFLYLNITKTTAAILEKASQAFFLQNELCNQNSKKDLKDVFSGTMKNLETSSNCSKIVLLCRPRQLPMNKNRNKI